MTGKGAERLRRYRNLSSYGQPFYDEAEQQWFLEGRFIPLRGFEHIVKGRRIQREIARHVPDLPGLEPDQTLMAATAGPAKPKLTAGFWVAIIIALTVTGFLVLLPRETQGGAMSILFFIVCAVGSVRMAIAAYLTWRARFRLLGFLYALLAGMLASLCFSLR
jgi:hypothetical protein